MTAPTWDDAIRALRRQYGDHGTADWLERNRPDTEGDIDWNADARRLSAGLLAIHSAPDTATTAALKSVAYDIALNCIDADTAAFQIERRSKQNPELAQAGLTADSGNGSANVSEGVTGGGECAVGDAAGEAGGHLQPVDDPAARVPCAIAGPSLLRPAETCPPGRITDAERERIASEADRLNLPETAAAWRESAPQLKCPGVGRDRDNICALQFYFSRPVADDEMRFLHDVIKRAVACLPDPCRGSLPAAYPQ